MSALKDFGILRLEGNVPLSTLRLSLSVGNVLRIDTVYWT